MTDREINNFIDKMGKIGDRWTPEHVRLVYGKRSYSDALQDRQAAMNSLINIINEVIQ
jgi:hypothetical protein